jgi:phage shock protein C
LIQGLPWYRAAAESVTIDPMKTELPASNTEIDVDTESPTQQGPHRLYRSRDDKMVTGVAGGIGEYFGIDPVLVRLAIVFSTALGGLGFGAYVLATFIVPKRPRENTDRPQTTTGRFKEVPGAYMLRNRSLGAWIAIGIAIAFLFDELDVNVVGSKLWPLLLIGGGVTVLLRRRDAESAKTAQTGPSPDAWNGSPSATLFRDTRPTRKDLAAEALAELHDPVVDEVERAVAELRADRMAEQGPRSSQFSATRPTQFPARSNRFRRLIKITVLFSVVVLVAISALGIRVLGRGVGTRTIVPSTTFTETFGAGKLVTDLRKFPFADSKGTIGSIKLDFGQVVIQLPKTRDRPDIEVFTKTRLVSVAMSKNGSAEVNVESDSQSSTRIIKGCPSTKATKKVKPLRLNVSLLGGNVTVLPAPCPLREKQNPRTAAASQRPAA